MSVSTTVEPFLPNSIPFAQYVEQLEYVFLNNNVPETRYKTSFLAVCGVTVFSEIKKLFPGQEVKNLSYQQIVEALQKRFDKVDSEVIHSFKFWRRRQGKYEKSEDFVIAVKVLAEQCGFGNFKDRAIRDLLVIGVLNSDLQKRLCDEDDLTAVRAEKIILNHEISNNRTSVLKSDDERNTSIVARLGQRDTRSRSKHRYRGSSRSSNRSVSFSPRKRYYDRKYNDGKPLYLCSFCKKRGHTRKFCYRLNGGNTNQADVKFLGSPKPSTSGGSSGHFKRSVPSEDDDDDMPCMMIASVNRINQACYVEVLVEKTRLSMEIDCGSAETVISEKLYLRCFKKQELLPCSKSLAVIDGKKLKVLGKMKASIQIDNQKHLLHLVVLRCDVDFVPLMGRSWLDWFYKGWRNVFAKPVTDDENIHMLQEQSFIDKIKYFSRRQSGFGTQAAAEVL